MNLIQNEEIILSEKISKIIFIPSIIFFIISIVFFVISKSNYFFSLIFLIFSSVSLIKNLFLFLSTKFILTNKKIIIQSGIFFIDSFEFMLNKIESISINKSIIGKILGYGTINIAGTGGHFKGIDFIKNPDSLKLKVQEEISKN